jgi:hypothetical protein
MGIFQTLVTKYKAAKQKSLDKEAFRKALLAAAADGKITPEEIAQLDALKQDLGLTDGEVRSLRAQAYTAAFAAAKADADVTSEEEQELRHIQAYLKLQDQEIPATKRELARLRLLSEIKRGNMPAISQPSNIILQKDERAYWVEPSALMEEKVIRRTYQGGSHGVSFRVMKGVSYRVGSSRGHIVSETGMVPVSRGELVITSRRIIFHGDRKSFAAGYHQLLDVQFFNNGLKVSQTTRTSPYLVKFAALGNNDIIGAVLSYSINHFNK